MTALAGVAGNASERACELCPAPAAVFAPNSEPEPVRCLCLGCWAEIYMRAERAGSMTDHGLGWRVSWQDYRGWRTKDVKEPKPPVRFRDFMELADAERERRIQRAAGMTVCLTPILPPKSRRGRYTKLPPGESWPVRYRPGFGT